MLKIFIEDIINGIRWLAVMVVGIVVLISPTILVEEFEDSIYYLIYLGWILFGWFLSIVFRADEKSSGEF